MGTSIVNVEDGCITYTIPITREQAAAIVREQHSLLGQRYAMYFTPHDASICDVCKESAASDDFVPIRRRRA